MAFNIFSTSINICSLAISFSSPPYGNREFLYPMHGCTRAPTRVSPTYTHRLAQMYIRTNAWKPIEERKREIFWDLFYGSRGRENKVLPNFGKHGVVFARPVKRSVSIGTINLCAHIHIENVSVCVIQCVRRMTSEIACLLAVQLSPHTW